MKAGKVANEWLRAASAGIASIGLLLFAAACTSLSNSAGSVSRDASHPSPLNNRPTVTPPSLEGHQSFYSEQLHARVTLPPGWVGVDGAEPLMPQLPGMGPLGLGPALAAFNSWGDDGFWAHATAVDCCGFQYGGQNVMDQLQEDGAYIVVLDDSPRVRSDSYVEHDSSRLTDLWPTRDCRSGDSAAFGAGSGTGNDSTLVSPPDNNRNGSGGVSRLSFCKWTHCYTIEVYCAPGISDATAEAVTSLLQSWQFDDVPEGDESWATLQAVRALPEDEMALFSPLTGIGGRWMESGETMETLITQVSFDEDAVVVLFSHRWNDPPNQTGSRECPEDRCHWWRVEVDTDGEAFLMAEGGAPLP